MGAGRRVKEAREARRLSLRDVSDRTKIPVRLLAALEAEQYSHLPGGIFGRGFVRAAATAVGLSPEELAAEFVAETTPPEPAVAAAPAPAPDRNVLRPRPAGFPVVKLTLPPVPGALPWIAGAVLVAVVVAVAWLGRSGAPPETPMGGTPGAAPVGQADPNAAAEAAPVATSGRDGAAAGPVEPDSRGVPIRLEVDRPSWVALTVDGRRAVYRILQPPDTVTVQMRESATLRTGDAGALRIAVGGGPPRTLGGSGEVRTVSFTPATWPQALAR